MVVDVLHHLLAPLVLEIDVDVGRLVARGGDEPLEQEVVLGGIDLGDPQAVAERRIGRRAAPLAQDLQRTGVADDVVDGEEIGGVVEVLHRLEFMVERRPDLWRNASGIAPGRARRRKGRERLLLACIARPQFEGVVVAQVREREGDALEEAHGFGERAGQPGKQPGHLAGRLEVALGMGGEPQPGLVQGHALADAGDDVGELAPRGGMHRHVVGGEERHAGGFGERRPPPEGFARAGAIGDGGAEPDVCARFCQSVEEPRNAPKPLIPALRTFSPAGRRDLPGTDRFERNDVRRSLVKPLLPTGEVAEGRKRAWPGKAGHLHHVAGRRRNEGSLVAARLQHDQLQAGRDRRQIAGEQDARPFSRAQIACRQQPGEAAIGRAVLRIGEDVGRAVGEDESHARHEAEGRVRRQSLLHIGMGAHDPGHRIAVGQAEPGIAERLRHGHELFRVRGAAQETEIAEGAEFGEGRAHQPNSPCTYQRGWAVSANSPSRNSQKRRPSRSSARK